MLGSTCRSKGEPHLVDIRVPGELVDPSGSLLSQNQWGLLALGSVTFITVEKKDLQSLLDEIPALTFLFWRECEMSNARYRQWYAKLTNSRAIERVAFLLSDLFCRLRKAGKVHRDGFRFPLTRGQIARLCGLSEVHLSRCILDLHDAGLVQLRASRIRIIDEDRLSRLGKWYPLHAEGDECV